MWTSRRSQPVLAGTPLAGAFTALQVVDEQVEPGTAYDFRSVTALGLLLTVSGGAQGRIDGHALRYRPDTLVCFAPGCRISDRSAGGWRVRYLWADGPLPRACAASLARHGASGALLQPVPAALRARLDEAFQATLREAPDWAWLLLAAVSAAMQALVAAPLRAKAGPATLEERVAALFAADPAAPWPTSRLARQLGLRPSTLMHRFRRETGLPPARWLRLQRLGLARTLLDEGLGVAVVAERLGFSSAPVFSRAYATALGAPPSGRRRGALGPLHEGQRPDPNQPRATPWVTERYHSEP